MWIWGLNLIFIFALTDEEDDSPAQAASQALDTLALVLPTEKYINTLMLQVMLSTHLFCIYLCSTSVLHNILFVKARFR